MVVVVAVVVVGNVTTEHVAVLTITQNWSEMSTYLPRQDVNI